MAEVSNDPAPAAAAPATPEPAASEGPPPQAVVDSHGNTLRPSSWHEKPARPVAPNGATLQAVKDSRTKNREDQAEYWGGELDKAVEETKAAQDVKGRALGAWGVLRGAVMTGVAKAAVATASGVEAANDKVANFRFSRHFPYIAGSEAWKVFGIFSCQAVHDGMPVSGTLYITHEYICYFNGGSLKFAVPFRDVVSIGLCVGLHTYEGRPYLVPRPSTEVVANAVQIFVNDHRLFELVNIKPDTSDVAAEATNSAFKLDQAAAMCHATLYDAWNNIVPEIPVPGIEYSAL